MISFSFGVRGCLVGFKHPEPFLPTEYGQGTGGRGVRAWKKDEIGGAACWLSGRRRSKFCEGAHVKKQVGEVFPMLACLLGGQRSTRLFRPLDTSTPARSLAVTACSRHVQWNGACESVQNGNPAQAQRGGKGDRKSVV